MSKKDITPEQAAELRECLATFVAYARDIAGTSRPIADIRARAQGVLHATAPPPPPPKTPFIQWLEGRDPPHHHGLREAWIAGAVHMRLACVEACTKEGAYSGTKEMADTCADLCREQEVGA